MMLTRHHPPAISLGVGLMPFALVTGYVFTLRQGKPKSFDTDLLETLATGPVIDLRESWAVVAQIWSDASF